MNHPGVKRFGRWRRTMTALLLGTAGLAPAEEVRRLPDPAAVEALQCLQRRAEPLQLPPASAEEGGGGFARVKLSFERPDQPPTITPLAYMVSPALDLALKAYLQSYRLPCLTPAMGTVTAVQEFEFDALADAEGRPLRLVESDAPAEPEPDCLIMPATPPEASSRVRDHRVSHVVLQFSFEGDGAQPPQLKMRYSNASGAFESLVSAHAAQYRMPCRRASDRRQSFEQLFRLVPTGADSKVLTKRQWTLRELLPLMELAPAFFDFKTMACPFQLHMSYRRPALDNQLAQIGASDINRSEFMAWLGRASFKAPASMQAQLMGERLVIDVPCTVLDTRRRAAGS